MSPAGRRAALSCVLAVVLGAGGATVGSHELSRSTSRVIARDRRVDVSFAIGAVDFHQGPVVDADGDGRASADEIDAAIAAVFAALKRNFRVTADGKTPESVLLERYGLEDGTTLRLALGYTFAAPVRTLAIESTLPAISQPDHRHLTRVTLGAISREAVLDAERTRANFDGGAAPVLETARRFVALGVEHIATGYDHLAFLVVLLVGAARLGDVVTIVTAFTVAHSVTLGLATFEVVTLPSALIETLIALSIAWVAAENLLADHLDRRWRLAFLFGLVHGFGFSNVLRDLALPPGTLALSLFTFNLGVEIGQLVAVALAYPLLAWAMRTAWRTPVALVGSSAVLCLGVYWFVQRLLIA